MSSSSFPSCSSHEVSSAFKHYLSKSPTLSPDKYRVAKALVQCRTESLGYNVRECNECDYKEYSYNSCRNRHCPKCQGSAAAKWTESRVKELLPVKYFHLVFTLPSEFRDIAYQNKRVVYDLFFKSVSETLKSVALDDRHLGGEIGFFSILHTWNQKLEYHPHIHVVAPGGSISLDRQKWKASKGNFFLPVKVLSELSRKKFISYLRRAKKAGKLSFYGKHKELADNKVFSSLLSKSWDKKSVVYAKRPFGGPKQVVKYLASYTHRIAISNYRIQKVTNNTVSFRFRDSKNKNRKNSLTLSIDTFCKRFLLHVLPKQFVRIRHYGFYSTANKSKLLAIIKTVICTNQSSDQTIIAPFQARCPCCADGILSVSQVYQAFTSLRPRAPPKVPMIPHRSLVTA